MLLLYPPFYIHQAYIVVEEQKKGMDGSQITGASSSYARKFALQGLFSLDDNADADSYSNEIKETNETKEHFSNDEWYDSIRECTTMAELMELYTLNKQEVDANARLKKLFADQKTKVK